MGSRARSAAFVLTTVTLATAGETLAQEGPDVVYTEIQCVWHWGQVDGVRGYSLGSHTCNLGDQNLAWGETTPLLAMNAYRLHEGRLVQIGMSFVKNGTFAAAGGGCGEFLCNGQGGDVLGAGCRDIYGCSFNGGQAILGPRSAVNPLTGAYPGPSGGVGDATYKRLQIAAADLAFDDARYFVEGQYVAADDAAAGNALNNASYKEVTVGGNFGLDVTGPMFIGDPAIYAWPGATVTVVDVPDEGRFHVASKVTDLGNGMWRYDYAVRNFNSHRGARSFTVDLSSGAAVANIGFHDVDYHSGEPFDGTDWASNVDNDVITWATGEGFDQNPDANALRWGTMYNFWFDANRPPTEGLAALGLFRPGDPGAILLEVTVPGVVPCADIDGDGGVGVEDFVQVILSWGPCGDCPADTNQDGVVDVTDLFNVIITWGACE